MDVLGWAVVGVLGAAVLYAASWLASRAFFDNKIWYHREMLRQLEVERAGSIADDEE